MASPRRPQCRLSFDLGVSVTAGTHGMYLTLIELGYHGCALNHQVTESAVSTHKHKPIGNIPHMLIPVGSEEEYRALKQLSSFGLGGIKDGSSSSSSSSFIILDRITVNMARSESLCHLERLQDYDIVALRPESDSVIWTLLGDETLRNQVDVISLDLSPNGASAQVTLKRGLVEAIRKAGLFIELDLGEYMRSLGDQRAEILARGAYILRWSGHGDGVILTSGARNIMDVRSPTDFDNWGRACLEEGSHRSRRFITTSEAAVRHGIWRKSESGIILVE